MIKDRKITDAIVRDLNVVFKFCEWSHRQWQGPTAYIIETRPEEAYNLPLVLAYCLLETTLKALVRQGTFKKPKERGLKALMDASRAVLTWKDFATVDSGREARNDLAHEGKLVPARECVKYVEAIADELHHWKIVFPKQ